MTERDLNQIINKYEELGNRIREYTRINYIEPELIDRLYFKYKNDSYYIDEWDVYNEDKIYVIIKNSWFPDFSDCYSFKKEDLVNYINSEFGGTAFI